MKPMVRVVTAHIRAIIRTILSLNESGLGLVESGYDAGNEFGGVVGGSVDCSCISTSFYRLAQTTGNFICTERIAVLDVIRKEIPEGVFICGRTGR